MARFVDEVRAEARAQRALLDAGRPIPTEMRRFARRQGALAAASCWLAGVLVVALGLVFDTLYYGAALFLFALGLVGAVQAVWGRNFLVQR